MLVLKRRSGEGISFRLANGDRIRILVEPVRRGIVKCVIDAPPDVGVDRIAEPEDFKRTSRRPKWTTKSITR